MEVNQIINGDCLEVMKSIPDKSVDMILCDLPYAVTNNVWDSVIPFDLLWEQYNRIVKGNSGIVLTSAGLFTIDLINSNRKKYKYTWIWNKKLSGSFQNAKYRPLQITEDVVVFGDGRIKYKPLMRKGVMRSKGYKVKSSENQTANYNGLKKNNDYVKYDEYYPVNIIEIPNTNREGLHPTQKPVALFEYLIRTYTNEGETVLDNCSGSGTTAIACINTNRNYICIEKDKTYFDLSVERVNSHKTQTNLFKVA